MEGDAQGLYEVVSTRRGGGVADQFFQQNFQNSQREEIFLMKRTSLEGEKSSYYEASAASIFGTFF